MSNLKPVYTPNILQNSVSSTFVRPFFRWGISKGIPMPFKKSSQILASRLTDPKCRPHIVQQEIELACFQGIARHSLRIDIPQLRHYIQVGAELYDFAIDSQTDHDSRLAFFVYLILPNVEKNLECTLAHNTSFFCLFAEGKNF